MPDKPRSRRTHRILTIPSGVVVFLCLFLPGYRECGANYAMEDKPALAGACLLGLVVVFAVLAVTRRPSESAVAGVCSYASAVAAVLMSFGVAAFDHTFVGMRLAVAALVGLSAGCLCWLFEAIGVRRHRMTEIVVALTLAALTVYATIAATATWHPPPESHPDYGPVFVVH